jgi:hypothetical protein
VNFVRGDNVMKNKLNDEIPYLVIVGVVAVVAIVSLVLNGDGNFDGAYTSEQFVEPDSVVVDDSMRVSTCYDQDGGLNDFSTKNYVQIGTRRYYDFCQGDNVREYSCTADGGRRDIGRIHPCEFGCAQGRCCNQGEVC